MPKALDQRRGEILDLSRTSITEIRFEPSDIFDQHKFGLQYVDQTEIVLEEPVSRIVRSSAARMGKALTRRSTGHEINTMGDCLQRRALLLDQLGNVLGFAFDGSGPLVAKPRAVSKIVVKRLKGICVLFNREKPVPACLLKAQAEAAAPGKNVHETECFGESN